MRDLESTGRRTLIQVTPGITEPRIASDPLGTEGELSIGPDHINPYRSAEERRIVEEIKRREQEAQDDDLFKTGRDSEPRGPRDSPLGEPPGFWSTPATADLPGLDAFDPLEFDGPQF